MRWHNILKESTGRLSVKITRLIWVKVVPGSTSKIFASFESASICATRKSPHRNIQRHARSQGFNAFQYFKAGVNHIGMVYDKCPDTLPAADETLSLKGTHGFTQGSTRNAQFFGKVRF